MSGQSIAVPPVRRASENFPGLYPSYPTPRYAHGRTIRSRDHGQRHRRVAARAHRLPPGSPLDLAIARAVRGAGSLPTPRSRELRGGPAGRRSVMGLRVAH